MSSFSHFTMTSFAIDENFIAYILLFKVPLHTNKSLILGKLVSLKGTVIRAAHTKLVCEYLAFKCSQCEGSQLVKQIDGCYTIPTRCPTKGCRALSSFTPIINSPFNRNINWQIIKIQEILTEEVGILHYVHVTLTTSK